MAICSQLSVQASQSGFVARHALGKNGLGRCWLELAVVGQSIAPNDVDMGKEMQVNVTKDGDRALVRFSGRFDFNTHREFRSAVEPLVTDVGVAAVTIDFSAVEYLDSSALGMLLMLRERMSGAKKEVTLAGVHGNVKQVLDIANFGKLFQIT